MITKLGIQQFSLSNVSPSSKICFLGLAIKNKIFFVFFGPILTSFSDQSRHLIHNPKRSDKRCLVDSGDYNYSGCFSAGIDRKCPEALEKCIDDSLNSKKP